MDYNKNYKAEEILEAVDIASKIVFEYTEQELERLFLTVKNIVPLVTWAIPYPRQEPPRSPSIIFLLVDVTIESGLIQADTVIFCGFKLGSFPQST